MIDFHSHVLPGIDDGSKNPDMSIEMLERSKEQGVTTVIATPHYYMRNGSIDKFLLNRNKSYDILQEEIAKRNLDLPKILMGAEVAFCHELMKEDISKLCIGDTDTILIELPFTYWNDWLYDDLFEILTKYKLNVVIAHLERYVHGKKDMKKINPIAELDVNIQINADSILDWHQRGVIKKFFKEYRVDILASDMHNMTTRATNFGKAANRIIKKYGDETLLNMQENAKRLLNI